MPSVTFMSLTRLFNFCQDIFPNTNHQKKFFSDYNSNNYQLHEYTRDDNSLSKATTKNCIKIHKF